MLWPLEKQARLRALVLAALEQSALTAKVAQMTEILGREGAPVTPQGSVDLGGLWRWLTGPLGLPRPVAAPVLARVALYVNQHLQAQMSVPPQVGRSLETALAILGNPQAITAALHQAVEERLKAAESGRAGPAGRAGPGAQEAPGGPPAGSRAPEKAAAAPRAQEKPAPAAETADRKGRQAGPPVEKDPEAPARRSRREPPKWLVPVAGLAAALLIGGAVYRLLPQGGGDTIAEGAVSIAFFSSVLPAKEAKAENGVLRLVPEDDGFDALPQQEQEAKGTLILQLLNSSKIKQIDVVTRTKVHRLVRDPQGNVHAQAAPPSGEAAQQ